MKRLHLNLILASLAALTAFSACGGEKKNEKADPSPQQMSADSERLIYYSCPMDSHRHIHSSEAGSCSECGMELVAAVVTTEEKMEFYGCPMEAHSHVRQDSPGVCEGCGMTLEPMRLKKD